MWRKLVQILGVVVSMLNWVFVACTLAIDYWRVAQVRGQGGSSIVSVTWFWCNLWKDCSEESTAVVNCVDFGVLRTVKCGLSTRISHLVSGTSVWNNQESYGCLLI
jgi:hypothetical protein